MKKYIAVDIGGTSIKYGIVREDGLIMDKSKCKTGVSITSGNLVQKIITVIEDLLNNRDYINGIGISSAGQIDYKTGKVIYATDNLTGWTGVNIKEKLDNRFHLPIYVDNDVNCAALAEKWLGSAKNVSNFLCLTIGTGIGGAIFINDQLYRGQRGLAGEWGHMIIEKNGLLCNCGKKGCWECYASTKSLVEYVKFKININHNNIDGKYIFKMAQSGDYICQQAVERFVDYLGQGIANLVQIFNPSLVVIGGAVMAQGRSLLSKVKEKVDLYIMPSFAEDLKIEVSCNSEYAGLLGAGYGLIKREELS